MNDVETNVRVARIFDEAAALVREKNPRYGSSWRDQGWRGNLSRILEKAGRLRSMLWRRDPELLSVSSEHPRQTMLDMINTLAFAIINMDDGLEYGNEPQAANIASGSWGADVQAYYSEQSPVPVRTDPWPPQQYSDTALSNGDPSLDHPANAAARAAAEGSNEQTLADIPVPGEESHANKPSPKPRVNVQDRGSGPRKRSVTNRPQA